MEDLNEVKKGGLMQVYSKLSIFVAAFLLLGCVQYDAQSAQTLRDGTGPGSLCGALYQARQMDDADSVNALVAEYARRNPRTDERTMTRLRDGLVGPGMPENAAVCSWNAVLVNHSIGFGQNTKQYRGAGGSSFFFVNGRTGRVDFISA